MIRRIFLDMDDVLNRWSSACFAKFYGAPPPSSFFNGYFERHGYDVLGAVNELCSTQMSKQTFWDSFPREFWANVPVSDEAMILIGLCEQLVGKDHVCILTAPTLDPDCLAGKLEWIHRFMPKWLHRQFLVGSCKQFCAHPEALLIDDADKNVDRFREWGGHAILVPRPWNTLNAELTLPHVLRQLQYVESFNEWQSNARNSLNPFIQKTAMAA